MTTPSRNEEQTIRAKVDPGAISRMTELFSARTTQVINEVLQNARRSGASKVELRTSPAGRLTITDDGCGIAEPAVLLAFGESGWNRTITLGEKAAGMGLYALARCRPTIRSRTAANQDHGWETVLDEPHFRGSEAARVFPSEAAPQPHGTTVVLQVSEPGEETMRRWMATHRFELEQQVRFYPLEVTLDGERIDSGRDFLADCRYVRTWKGLRIGASTSFNARNGRVNFHGIQIRETALPHVNTLDGQAWLAHIDVQPGGRLELTLPTRNGIREGPAADQARNQARKTIYRALQDAAEHETIDLPWKDWADARDAGYDLPPATAALPKWTPHAERTILQTSSPVAPGCVVMAAGMTAADAEVTYAAMVKTPWADRVRAADARLNGYDWYDHLPRVTGVRTEVRKGTDTVVLRSNEEQRGRAHPEPDQITVVLEIDGGSVSDGRDVLLAADVAFNRTEDDDEDLQSGDLILRGDVGDVRTADLEDMITNAFFLASDEPDSDSHDTQEARFRRHAAAMIAKRLGRTAEGVRRALEELAESHLAGEIPLGWKATIELRRASDGLIHRLVRVLPGQTDAPNTTRAQHG